MQTIQFEKRDKAANLNKIRKTGNIPAVFYGPKEASTPISVKEVQFKKVWKEAGESSIIVLKDGNDEHEALINDVDVHPVSGVVRHADFYVIEKGKKLEVSIPLEFIGVAPAVKDLGGILVKVVHELEIEALPKDLPHDIQVDISMLTGLDSQILAKDLKLPAGVELKVGADEVIAAIAVAKEEVEEVAPVDISAIEVVGAKGKEEVEGEAGEAPAAAAEKSEKEKKAPEKK